MLYGLVNDVKVEAKPHLKGLCPSCGNKIIAHCGDVYKWHCKHESGESCDEWFESETEWHLEWKRNFFKENTEVRIGDKSHWHIADIYIPSKVVIELQNSPIDLKTISDREVFYGEQMFWVLNHHRIKIIEKKIDELDFRIRMPFNIFFSNKILPLSN